MRRDASVVFVALLLLPAASARAVILVTSCGQRLPAGETGDLVNDLVCTDGGSAMALDGGATLNLNGFTIRGDGRGVGISCFGRGGRRPQPCTVNGPGEITGFEAGISGGGCRFVARNLTVSRNKHGIYIPKSCDLDAANVAASENGELEAFGRRTCAGRRSR